MRVRPYRNRSKTGRVRVPDAEGVQHTILDETGKVYGELFVVRFLRVTQYQGRKNAAVFLCTCSCGQYCEVIGNALRRARNNTFSCGHVRQGLASQSGEHAIAFKHGHATKEHLPTYGKWAWANGLTKPQRLAAARQVAQ